MRFLLAICILVSIAFAEAPRVVPEIVDSIPHEKTHFTQGLFFLDIHFVFLVKTAIITLPEALSQCI